MLTRRHLLAAPALGLAAYWAPFGARLRAGRQETGAHHRRLPGRRRNRHHRPHRRRAAARILRADGAGREQARRGRAPLGRVRQECRARRQRDAVHAGFSDHRSIRTASGRSTTTRCATSPRSRRRPRSMLTFNVGPAVPARRQDARRLRAMVQGQPRQGERSRPPRPAARRISSASCWRTRPASR